MSTFPTDIATPLPGRAVSGGQYPHVMAIALDPNDHRRGIIRCIVRRQGKVDVSGYLDFSQIYHLQSDGDPNQFAITTPLEIKNSQEIIEQLSGAEYHCLGLEDPDLVFDQNSQTYHLYFTMPIIKKVGKGGFVYLGHAQGPSIEQLTMTMPVVDARKFSASAKELSFAPANKRGLHLHLVESNHKEEGIHYSTVNIAKASVHGGSWQLLKPLLHPKYHGYAWCAEHMSPGPLLPRSFVDLGPDKLLGFLNGRSASDRSSGQTIYGKFTVGLFVYNYQVGRVEYLSLEPLIEDLEAQTITFASQFIETADGRGILYAHVDDSFVRAYSIDKEKLIQFVSTLALNS